MVAKTTRKTGSAFARTPFFLFVVLACGAPVDEATEAPEAPVEAPPTPETPDDYQQALEANARQIAHHRRRLAGRTRRLELRQLTAHLLDRAKLTGRIPDYAAALRMLERTYAELGLDAGPNALAATVYAAVHRLDDAEEAIDRAEGRILGANRPALRAARGSLYLQRGMFEEAERLTAELPNHRAFVAAARADYDAAEEALDTIRFPRGRGLATLHFTRGMFDFAQGRHDEALRHYQDADEAFRGWPLVWEHMAEVYQALGRLDLAEALYRRVVERTGSPSAMTMLALCVEPDEAAMWLRRAERTHREDLALLPEAAAGHALDYFLHHGELGEALDLAMQNHALRPGGEATTKLAQALARAGQWEHAAARLEALHATPFRSAESLATEALAAQRLGRSERAERLELEARALHPGAMDLVTWLR